MEEVKEDVESGKIFDKAALCTFPMTKNIDCAIFWENERAKSVHCYKKKRMTVNYKNLKYRIESKAFSKSVPGA